MNNKLNKNNRIEDLVILGVTGSIGTQTVKVCVDNGIKVLGISFNENLEKALEINSICHPVLIHTYSYENYKKLVEMGINSCYGDDGIKEIINLSKNVVNAIMGTAGIKPTYYAISNGCDVMLANKETLVACGEVITKKALEMNVNIWPIDSEHNALYRLIKNERLVNNINDVKRLIITASGGSFRDKTREDLKTVNCLDALNHPNWQMGKKITIDSSTMVNKGLEVIEAHYLYNIDYDKIETIIHPESVIHSMVEYKDNSVGAIMYNPSMIIPIQNAILNDYHETDVKSLDFVKLSKLTFREMDYDRFPMVKLAYMVGKKKGLYPAVYNASNEAAVGLFLNGKISFLKIEEIIIESLDNFEKSNMNIDNYDLDDVINIDLKVKERINEVYNK